MRALENIVELARWRLVEQQSQWPTNFLCNTGTLVCNTLNYSCSAENASWGWILAVLRQNQGGDKTDKPSTTFTISHAYIC